MLQSFALLLRATYRWRWVWSNGEIILRGENWSTGRKTLSSATLSTTNPIRINQALKRSFRGESSATNRTNTMEQSSSWAARRSWVSQETPRTLWHPKVHYRIHKSPPPVPILSKIDSARPHSIISKIHFNIILPSTCQSSKGSTSFRFIHENFVCTSTLPRTCYIPCLSKSFWFDHLNGIW